VGESALIQVKPLLQHLLLKILHIWHHGVGRRSAEMNPMLREQLVLLLRGHLEKLLVCERLDGVDALVNLRAVPEEAVVVDPLYIAKGLLLRNHEGELCGSSERAFSHHAFEDLKRPFFLHPVDLAPPI
jgi:hypothetical protein